MLGGVGACETYLVKQAFADGGGFGQYLNITEGVWLLGSEGFGLCGMNSCKMGHFCH